MEQNAVQDATTDPAVEPAIKLFNKAKSLVNQGLLTPSFMNLFSVEKPDLAAIEKRLGEFESKIKERDAKK